MNDNTTPPKTLQKELFKTWNYHTRKNGFKPVSRGGVSVYQTPFTNHSGSREIKSIEEQTQIYGTTEYWENELHKIHTDETYTNPYKTTEEIEQELKTRYRVTKTTRRGKIQRPKTLPPLTQKDLQTNVLIDTHGKPHSIQSLSKGHFMKKTIPSPMKKPKDTSKNLEEVSKMDITVNSMKPRMVESDTNGRKTQREFIHD